MQAGPLSADLEAARSRISAESTGALREHSRLRHEAKARGEKPPSLADVKYGGKHDCCLANDRTVINYLEQLLPFLISLVCYSLFVSANGAAVFGWSWLLFRSYYPVVFRLPFPALLASTIPAYWCVWWMLGAAVYSATMLVP
jgi:hypothetical protein